MASSTSRTAPVALDRFGFPVLWSVQTRREMRRVQRLLAAMPAAGLARLEAARAAADAVVRDDPTHPTHPTHPAHPADDAGEGRRIVVVLPLPIDTGGMRVLVDFADALGRAGAEVHLLQVRGDDSLAERHAGLRVRSRTALEDPRHLAAALRRLAPATLLVGGWMDYFAALESGAGPVVGYSAGEAVLYGTDGFDADLVRFVDRMHRLPVTLLAGSQYVRQIFRDRFERESYLVSVPIAGTMFRTRPAPPPAPPFRVLLIGPEHNLIKAVPGALEALDPLRAEGFRIVWISPGPPSPRLAGLVDELWVDRSPAEVADIVAGAHALVFPSVVEGLGNPPLEAMAAGVPPVLCANRGSEEYARPEENCLMYPHGDGPALRAAVRRLRAEPDLAARIRRAGPVTAQEYRPERVHDRLRRFLDERAARLPVPGPPARVPA